MCRAANVLQFYFWPGGISETLHRERLINTWEIERFMGPNFAQRYPRTNPFVVLSKEKVLNGVTETRKSLF